MEAGLSIADREITLISNIKAEEARIAIENKQAVKVFGQSTCTGVNNGKTCLFNSYFCQNKIPKWKLFKIILIGTHINFENIVDGENGCFVGEPAEEGMSIKFNFSNLTRTEPWPMVHGYLLPSSAS